MAPNKAHDVTGYAFSAGERVLVDANVWLFLFPPTAQPPHASTRRYSAAMKNLLTANARPVVNAIVLSEYLNRYWQIEWGAWRRLNKTAAKTLPRPKDFRKSAHFGPIGAAAVADARLIVKQCSRQQTPLQSVNLDEVFSEFANGTFDFNDGLLIENCRLRGWKMLTDDGDMTKGGIDVLTTNAKLLAACP